MYFLLVYALITLIAWILALNIRPERYLGASTEAVLEWKYKRIKSAKQYAFLTLIFLFALIALNYIASHYVPESTLAQKETQIPVFLSVSVFAMYLYMAYMIFFLCFSAFKNYKLAKDLGIL
ncbi:hypothetical protein L3V86_02555 [Thiotrichales bacterium 19S11-10]|nr:hypothetical protein [Thiotrichales bacterium 19S11-10]